MQNRMQLSKRKSRAFFNVKVVCETCSSNDGNYKYFFFPLILFGKLGKLS